MSSQKTKLIFTIIALLILAGLFVFSGLGKSKGSDSNTARKAETFSGTVLMTNFGEIEVQFATGTAPLAVSNFAKLAEKSFYDGTLFHRVTKDFIQGEIL